MSDPIICIECGATSYNEPGKTPIRCASCWEKLKARAKKAEARLAELEKANDLYDSLTEGINLVDKYNSMTNEDAFEIINGPWAETQIYSEFSTLLEIVAERLKRVKNE